MAGTVAYHQQQPWIINTTVQENILFGLPLQDERFRAVIEKAALQVGELQH